MIMSHKKSPSVKLSFHALLNTYCFLVVLEMGFEVLINYRAREKGLIIVVLGIIINL